MHKQKRIVALIDIKSSKSVKRTDIPNHIGVHIRTLERWVNQYINGSVEELLRDKTRRKGSKIITKEMHQGLFDRVHNPKNSFLGYWDVHQWIASKYNVKVCYHLLRKYMIQHFGMKVKSPRKSHIKKDDKAIALFKKAR